MTHTTVRVARRRPVVLALCMIAPLVVLPAAHADPGTPLALLAQGDADGGGWTTVALTIEPRAEVEITLNVRGLQLAPEDGFALTATFLTTSGRIFYEGMRLVTPEDEQQRRWGFGQHTLSINGATQAWGSSNGTREDFNVTYRFLSGRDSPQELLLLAQVIGPVDAYSWRLSSNLAQVHGQTEGNRTFLRFENEFEARRETFGVAGTTLHETRTIETTIHAQNRLFARLDGYGSPSRPAPCVVASGSDAPLCPPFLIAMDLWHPLPQDNPPSSYYDAAPGNYTFQARERTWREHCVDGVACTVDPRYESEIGRFLIGSDAIPARH